MIGFLGKLSKLTDPTIYTLYAGDVKAAKKVVELLLHRANQTISRVNQEMANSFMWVSSNVLYAGI